MKVYNLNEITDSKIIYDKKPPAFMKYIILIVTALIVVALIWANKSVKTYMVKGQGIVESENKSNIMTKSLGEITEVFVKEGSQVKVGDVLFKTSGLETNLQLEQIDSQIETYTTRIKLLKQAEDNATNGTNYFDRYDELESEFYNKLSVAYIARKEFNVDVETLKKEAIKQVEEEMANISENDKENIEKIKKEKLDSKLKQINDYVVAQKNKSDEQYFKTISEFTTERNQYETELSKLIAQKEAYEKSKEQYIVTAQEDGVVHLITPLTTGMVIQGGSLIGTISNKKEQLIVETMLPSSDRPRIHIGDEVALAIGGLLQSEYGTIQGKVVSIDEDATIDNEKGSVYFKVKVKPDKTYLEDSKGERVNLTIGMVAETRVKYEKITYMKYFLELIGIKFS